MSIQVSHMPKGGFTVEAMNWRDRSVDQSLMQVQHALSIERVPALRTGQGFAVNDLRRWSNMVHLSPVDMACCGFLVRETALCQGVCVNIAPANSVHCCFLLLVETLQTSAYRRRRTPTFSPDRYVSGAYLPLDRRWVGQMRSNLPASSTVSHREKSKVSTTRTTSPPQIPTCRINHTMTSKNRSAEVAGLLACCWFSKGRNESAARRGQESVVAIKDGAGCKKVQLPLTLNDKLAVGAISVGTCAWRPFICEYLFG
jgi:hypothetical protein